MDAMTLTTPSSAVGTHRSAKGIARIKTKRIWKSAGVPAAAAGSQAATPLQKGDWIYDSTNADGYVVTVAVTANTAATVVKMNP